MNTSTQTLSTADFRLYRYRVDGLAAFHIDLKRNGERSLDTYYLYQCQKNYTIGYDADSSEPFNSHLVQLGQNNAQQAIISNGTISINGYTLKYNKSADRFLLTKEADNNDLETAKLYRLVINEEIIHEADSYRNDFDFIRDNVCDFDGYTAASNLESYWEGVALTYYEKGPDAQRYLSSLTYGQEDYAKNTNESVVKCYDYILGKYGPSASELYDYMFPDQTGAMQPYYDPQLAYIVTPETSNTSSLPLVILVSVSLANAGIYLVIKKRHLA